MAFIEWTEELSVRVRKIDEQHMRLVQLVNDIHATVVAGSERQALIRIFDELINYTVYHFKTEEDYFEAYRYEDKDAHKVQHNELTQKALDLQKSFQDGSATISYEVLDFLHDWLVTHIKGSDRKFGSFLIAATRKQQVGDAPRAARPRRPIRGERQYL